MDHYLSKVGQYRIAADPSTSAAIWFVVGPEHKLHMLQFFPRIYTSYSDLIHSGKKGSVERYKIYYDIFSYVSRVEPSENRIEFYMLVLRYIY